MQLKFPFRLTIHKSSKLEIHTVLNQASIGHIVILLLVEHPRMSAAARIHMTAGEQPRLQLSFARAAGDSLCKDFYFRFDSAITSKLHGNVCRERVLKGNPNPVRRGADTVKRHPSYHRAAGVADVNSMLGG